ncbi:oxytocin-neurophysin 1 isoform X2 [Folsomia candida]|uniref:oxytocin-neurophysin 1 isoform X2 n=1 Tax=Folsomia candida TaxID=158441 RepID=UPI000B9075D4|nr:oxytocin-neurophysin 1 isoform X2 [Folsomia candida]
MKTSLLFAFGIVMVESLLVSGCFITNCPPGGKRSGADTKIRQCEQCGPPGMNGLCYGPHICCSSELGCLFGTSETLTCFQENLMYNTPCQNPGESCSGNDATNPINGQCATLGVCCSSDTCTIDDNCHKKDEQQNVSGHSRSTVAMDGSHTKEHATTMFQNPLDRWIPRRFGLGRPTDTSGRISSDEY